MKRCSSITCRRRNSRPKQHGNHTFCRRRRLLPLLFFFFLSRSSSLTRHLSHFIFMCAHCLPLYISHRMLFHSGTRSHIRIVASFTDSALCFMLLVFLTVFHLVGIICHSSTTYSYLYIIWNRRGKKLLQQDQSKSKICNELFVKWNKAIFYLCYSLSLTHSHHIIFHVSSLFL